MKKRVRAKMLATRRTKTKKKMAKNRPMFPTNFHVPMMNSVMGMAWR